MKQRELHKNRKQTPVSQFGAFEVFTRQNKKKVRVNEPSAAMNARRNEQQQAYIAFALISVAHRTLLPVTEKWKNRVVI